MSYFCKVCGRLVLGCDRFGPRSHHQCPPLWSVRQTDEDEDEARIVRGRDYEEAAEAWAESYDQDDPTIACNEEVIEVLARPLDSDGELKKLKVSGRVEFVYSAEEVE